MKATTFFLKITKTVGVACPCGWRGLALIPLAVSLLIPPFAPQAYAQELTFGQAADEAAARVAEAFPIVQGSVVGVEGDRVLIDLGAKKVYQGMELQLYREGDEVKHPVTGEILGRRDKRLGLLSVVEVKEGFSEAVIASREGGSVIRIRDRVRVSSDRLTVALPLVDASEIKGVNAQSVTKDLAIALSKTGRFIVIEDPLIRATLTGEKSSRLESFTEPSILRLLAEKVHVQLLVVGKLSPSDHGPFMNVQAISVFTGAPLTVASVEVTRREPRIMTAPLALSGPTSRPGSGQPTSAVSRPSFLQVDRPFAEPSKTVEQPRGSRADGAPPQKAVVAEEALRKPGGTPSFLGAGDEPSVRSADRGVQDAVTFELPEALLSVAAGDLDGDQRPEIIGMTSSEVIVYRWQNQRPVPIARVGGPQLVRHLHLDVGDVNRRGHAQVIVTALSTARNDLRSFVLELQGDRLVRIAEGLGYFLRVLTGPGIDAPILIAQRMGELTPFEGSIVRLTWNGAGYLEGQPLTLPAQVKNLYEFAPIKATGDQILEVAVISEQRVKTYGSGGKPLWEGKDDLGEVDHLAFSHIPSHRAILSQHGLRSGIPISPEEYASQSILPRRVLVEASLLLGNAKTELLTSANPKTYGLRLFGGEPPASGQVVAFDRRDGTFARGWQTIPVEGKVRDIAVADLNGAGKRDLIVLSSVREKGLAAYLQDKSHGIINVFSFIR